MSRMQVSKGFAPPQPDTGDLIDLTGVDDNQIDYARATQFGGLVALQLQVTMPENGHWSLGRLTRLRPAAKTGIVIANNDKVFRGIIDTDGNIQSFQPMTATCSVDAVYITNE